MRLVRHVLMRVVLLCLAAGLASGQALARSPRIVAQAARADEEFIDESATSTTLHVVAIGADRACRGAIVIDRPARSFSWMPADTACTEAFTVPFDDVRSPAAAPNGGLVVRFDRDRPALTVMPAPDADLVQPGVDRMTFAELPSETRVHLRRAQRRIIESLGRPYSDALFGPLVDISLAELVGNAPEFEGAAVRTSGRLSASKGQYLLADQTSTVQLVLAPSTVELLENKFGEWNGKTVLIGGTFSRLTAGGAGRPDLRETAGPQFALRVSTIEPVEARAPAGLVAPLRLADLLKAPPGRKQQVRVIGRYRGANSFIDLPLASRRSPNDWVIKDQTIAVWILGRQPTGKGFALTPNSPIDTTRWVAVTGTVEARGGILYVHASRVELSPPPPDAVVAESATLRSGKPTTRPDVKFTVPVEGVEEAARDEPLLIQFTKPMDEASFANRVQLRYSGGDVSMFSHLTATYRADRTFAIIVDPGVALTAGGTIECLLLPGIRDVDRLPLVGTDDGPRVLTWKVRAR